MDLKLEVVVLLVADVKHIVVDPSRLPTTNGGNR